METRLSSSVRPGTAPAPAVARAVVFRQPRELELSRLPVPAPGEGELLVDICWSGISTGTERLLWTGDMPPFPGMGYPLVPGYESVGRVRSRGPGCAAAEGDMVFVPGAQWHGEVRGLFGGAASRLVTPESRTLRISESLGERGVLLALAATAYHALRPTASAPLPELVIGHGVLGRLLARLVVAVGGKAPVVWETLPDRRDGATGYAVIDPADDDRRDYAVVMDASGDAGIIDKAMPHLARGGEIVLAGFYSAPLSFTFPPAFMREARMRVAAEWQPEDFRAVRDLAESGALDLDGLITHRVPAAEAATAYRTAFEDAACLKLVLDWRGENEC